uniref:Uncharacterized protein n=1 Tax=Romanomermis culicivorax TaxID=13658 RepID=A0A915KMX8_ROMCU
MGESTTKITNDAEAHDPYHSGKLLKGFAHEKEANRILDTFPKIFSICFDFVASYDDKFFCLAGRITFWPEMTTYHLFIFEPRHISNSCHFLIEKTARFCCRRN